MQKPHRSGFVPKLTWFVSHSDLGKACKTLPLCFVYSRVNPHIPLHGVLMSCLNIRCAPCLITPSESHQRAIREPTSCPSRPELLRSARTAFPTPRRSRSPARPTRARRCSPPSPSGWTSATRKRPRTARSAERGTWKRVFVCARGFIRGVNGVFGKECELSLIHI